MTDTEFPAELDALTRTVSAARKALDLGNPIDMTGLDRAVTELCAAAMNLPAADRRHAFASLAALGHDLAGLSAALSAHKAVFERADEAAQRRRAADAYPASAADSAVTP